MSKMIKVRNDKIKKPDLEKPGDTPMLEIESYLQTLFQFTREQIKQGTIANKLTNVI